MDQSRCRAVQREVKIKSVDGTSTFLQVTLRFSYRSHALSQLREEVDFGSGGGNGTYRQLPASSAVAALHLTEGMRLHAHSRCQASLALSSCEAEVMAASEGTVGARGVDVCWFGTL